MNGFKDRLSQRARDTARPGLAHQCRGRDLDARELALAAAMMKIYAEGEQDFAAVVHRLAELGVAAPRSGRTDWSVALLAEELGKTNRDLDTAYEANGYGA